MIYHVQHSPDTLSKALPRTYSVRTTPAQKERVCPAMGTGGCSHRKTVCIGTPLQGKGMRSWRALTRNPPPPGAMALAHARERPAQSTTAGTHEKDEFMGLFELG